MTRPEAFIITYVALAVASLAWAFWRVAHAPSVRSAVEGLPLSVAPLWVAVAWMAYAAGGTPLVLVVGLIAVVAIAGLWLLRLGVDRDSLPQETVPESALRTQSVPFATLGYWRVAILVGVFVFVVWWIAGSLQG